MPNDEKRLDESLSIDVIEKSLGGGPNIKPALDKITISPSGQVQPKACAPDSQVAPGSGNTADKINR
jgi:hypothetical protein